MAHFAELNSSNEVLQVIVISNEDVDANGGDESTQAETFVASSFHTEQVVLLGNKPHTTITLENNTQVLVILTIPLKINLYHRNLIPLGH
jgi:hypothetical protein